MYYAFVHDIAASWCDYERIAAPTIELAPVGLILHLAGPTDEGIRIIEVWESERAWECFLGDHGGPPIAALGGPRLPAARFRDLQPRHLVLPTLGPDTEPMKGKASKSTGPRRIPRPWSHFTIERRRRTCTRHSRSRQLSRFPIQTTTPKGSDMYKIKHTFTALLVLVVAFVALTVASAASADPNSIPTPTPVPGQPSCAGLDTASFAQDWKNFSFEPSGVGRLTRFYGGTPTDFTQSGRYDDCAP